MNSAEFVFQFCSGNIILMNLEIWSQISGILSAIFGIVALLGIGAVYRKVKISNKQNVVVNGDAVFSGSFNAVGTIDKEIK